MTNITGIAASTGIAIAKAYQLASPDLSFKKTTIDNPPEENKRLEDALTVSIQELEKIKQNTEKTIDKEHAEIYSAHIFVLSDPELVIPMKDKISTEQVRPERAL